MLGCSSCPREVLDVLEREHESLKTLKRRVVQLTTNARALGNALLQSPIPIHARVAEGGSGHRPEHRRPHSSNLKQLTPVARHFGVDVKAVRSKLTADAARVTIDSEQRAAPARKSA
jgi:hypothetical protein